MIKASAADKLQLNRSNDDLVLAEVKSNGERTVFKDHDVSIPTALYLNARIFVSSKDHIDALVSVKLIFYFCNTRCRCNRFLTLTYHNVDTIRLLRKLKWFLFSMNTFFFLS